MRLTVPAAVMVAMCACGGANATQSTSATASVPSTPLPTPDLTALRIQYQALLEPLGIASATFNNRMLALGSSATAAEVAAVASPYAMALRTYDAAVLQLPVPPSMKVDVQRLVTADRALESDLTGDVTVTGFTVPNWSQQITPDANRVVAASNVVRADLGLQGL